MTKTCELYLRIPAETCAAVDIAALLRAAPLSAVLITGPSASFSLEALRAFIHKIASQNVAVLIENDAALAKKLDADGVHLRAQTTNVTEARNIVGGEKVVGVSCPLTRHDAMVAGEQGASYVAFGEDASNLDEVAAMIRWWDELFEISSVGWLHEGYDDIALRMFIAAGADFLCIPYPRAAAGAVPAIARVAQFCSNPENLG